MKFPASWRRKPKPLPVVPESLWVAFTRCGCPCAWSITPPGQLTETDKQTITDAEHDVHMWLKLKGPRMTNPVHRIIRGDTHRDGPVMLREPDRLDWSLEGCKNPGNHGAPGIVLDAWFPPVSA